MERAALTTAPTWPAARSQPDRALATSLILTAGLLVAVAAPLLDRGGYRPGSQWLCASLGLGVGALALAVDRRAAMRALGRPPLVVLAALALLGIASASWAIVLPEAAVRWGAVLAGYCGVAVAAATLVRRERGINLLAGSACAIAALAAAIGLVGAMTFTAPYAERIGGIWRPGGPLEYPPALALLQVMALPALLRAMVRMRPSHSPVAASGAILAGAVIALANSRFELGLAITIGLIVIAAPQATLGCTRAVATVAAIWAALAGVAATLSIGGFVHASQRGHEPLDLIAFVTGTVLLVALWPLARSFAERMTARRARSSVALTLASVVVLSGVAIATNPSATFGSSESGGATHGRVDIWRASVEAATSGPVEGAGAGTFLAATVTEQRPPIMRYGHDLPLELAVELGIAGVVLALALYWTCARATWRTRHDRASWLFAAAVIAYLAANLVDWPWHLAAVGASWALSLGAIVGIGLGPGRPGDGPVRKRIDTGR